jgi:hypothetical protein
VALRKSNKITLNLLFSSPVRPLCQFEQTGHSYQRDQRFRGVAPEDRELAGLNWSHVEKASRNRTFTAVVGDARTLPVSDASYDVALLLGPLYHLPGSADRLAKVWWFVGLPSADQEKRQDTHQSHQNTAS